MTGDMLPHSAPEFRQISLYMLRLACRRAAADMRRAPLCGIFFAGFYVVFGWILVRIFLETGRSYWLVLAVGGFPIIAPFAAVVLYEVSRRLASDGTLPWREILGVILHQHKLQLPSLSAVLIVILLLWHMIFALFLGLSKMIDISSSLEVYLSINGFMMLAICSTVGALFALLVYMNAVFCTNTGGARGGFCDCDDRLISGGSKQFLYPADLGSDHCGVHIFVHAAMVFGSVSNIAFVWACGFASL